MKNPYEHLVIYYFESVPVLPVGLESDGRFLGSWEEDGTAFLFFNQAAEDVVSGVLDANPTVALADTYEMSCEQWHGDEIKSYSVADLTVSPPWEAAGTDREIFLDPGVVFGSGRHPTTEECLGLIHRLCTEEQIDSVLDIGTGTGLLALGAAALGCRRIMACDFNLLAVKTCLKNVRLNHFEDRILSFQARGETQMEIPCDLLVANIHYDVMRFLIESPALETKKWMIFSGLLNSEARKIMDRLKERNIHVLQRRCPDGVWNTLLARPAFFLD